VKTTTQAAKSIEQVARCLGLGIRDLQETAGDIESHYRSSRRLIGAKERTLLIPSDHLKSIQRDILGSLLNEIPPHPASFCTVGRGILKAAQRHLGHRYLLHLDLKDFFPSVRPARVRRVFQKAGFDAEAAELLAALTTFRNHLPQGAPTSVAVGNMVLERLDKSLWGLCRRFGLTYTRYVDDIAISGGAQVQSAESEVRRIIADCHWELSQKGGLMGPDHRPKLLGV
jgi:RNA-directed DNA polymerase